MPFAYRSFHKVQFPNGKVTVTGPIEERPTNILAKDTPSMRSGLISRKCHLPFVQQEVLRDARFEVTVPVCANPDNSQTYSFVIAAFPLFIEEVNSIRRQRCPIKWI